MRVKKNTYLNTFMQVVVYKILYIVLFLFCCVLYQVSDFSDLSAFCI